MKRYHPVKQRAARAAEAADAATPTNPAADAAPSTATAPRTDAALLPEALWWLPGAFFLLCVVVGAVAVIATPEAWVFPERGSWLRGERTARFERNLDAALPFREAAITTWGVLEYTLLGEGRPGVFIGEDDWLFPDEEFAVYPEEAARLSAALEEIERVQGVLAEYGAELVLALVPAKARVYDDKLGRHRLPAEVVARYDAFRSALAAPPTS
jgi:alginate O-acetyltransferase complex protein AlgJ